MGGEGYVRLTLLSLLAANPNRNIIHKSKPHLMRFTMIGRCLSEETETSRITWKEVGNNSVAANIELLVI